MLSRHEAETLREAIEIVRRLDKAVSREAYTLDGLDDIDKLHRGKVGEAMDAAGQALFNALSTASNYLDDPEAERAIRVHLGEEVKA
jgi:hypothetical protein